MSRIKKKQLLPDIDVEQYTNILNGLSGSTKFSDPIIVLDKFLELKSNIISINKLLINFNNNIVKHHNIINYDELKKFLKDLDENVLSEFNKDIQFNNVLDNYYKIKNRPEIVELMKILKVLSNYKSELSIPNFADVPRDFITKDSLDKIEIFSFSNLNLIDIYVNEAFKNDEVKTKKKLDYIIIFLHRLYDHLKNIYSLFTTPDIDKQKIANLIITTITSLKGKIKGCDKAFNKIESSIGMAVDNMDKYYNMFTATKNPSALFSGFLNDILSGNDEEDIDMNTILQLRKIIREFRKLNSSEIEQRKDFSQMFDQVDSLFDQLESIDLEDS